MDMTSPYLNSNKSSKAKIVPEQENDDDDDD